MTWPAIVIWILIAAAFAARGPRPLLYLMFATGAFGTLVMVPGNIVGGVNLLPESFCALFLITKLMLQPGILPRVALLAMDMRQLGVLALFLLWGLFTGYVMPRIFSGQVDVIPLNVVVPDPQPLVPTNANLTQSAYLIVSSALVFVCAIAGRNAEFRRHFLRAVLLGACVAIFCGGLDMATQGTKILAPFRNAGYALLTDAEILGSKRVVGLMPEASAYGSECVGLLSMLVFLMPCYEPKFRNLIVPLVIGGLVIMTLLSTSSTGYVGLAVLGAVYGTNLLWRLRSVERAAKRRMYWELGFISLGAVALVFLLLFRPNLFDPVSDMVDTVVFQKTNSDSYIERSGWNRYGLDAFSATDGWGVGLGSARTSNWYVSILSNTGFAGFALMLIFLVQIFLRRPYSGSREDRVMMGGLKLALLPGLVMAGLSGTTPDFGVVNGVLFGIITALSLTTENRTAVVRNTPDFVMDMPSSSGETIYRADPG